ncbi:MAG: metallophosphoesterase family protein [Phototrophicaceae bacterium]|jgi:putative phosphoesterase
MKIGVISDCHGDLLNLQAALDFLDGEAVDQIVCAGDLVDRLPHSNEVVALIRARDIPTVRGNHDHNPQQHEVLSDETLRYARTLPFPLTFEWAGHRVMLAHGTPWSLDQYIFPSSDPILFRQIAQFSQTDIVILGHTHTPMIVNVEDRCWVLNPGTTCEACSYGFATCGILTLDEGHVQLEPKFTVYDFINGMELLVDEVKIDR